MMTIETTSLLSDECDVATSSEENVAISPEKSTRRISLPVVTAALAFVGLSVGAFFFYRRRVAYKLFSRQTHRVKVPLRKMKATTPVLQEVILAIRLLTWRKEMKGFANCIKNSVQ